MTRFVFPDNTVLVNLTLVDRQDLLIRIVRDRGAWSLSVARECMNSARVPALAKMSHWRHLFGTPLAPTAVELVDAAQLTTSMRKPGEHRPGQHMGEAETIAIVTRRQFGATFVTDDHDAARIAQAHGIPAVSTTWVIAMAEASSAITNAEAHSILQHLGAEGRVLGPLPGGTDYDGYVRRLLDALRGG